LDFFYVLSWKYRYLTTSRMYECTQDNNLIAISQYFYDCFYKELLSSIDELQNGLVDFFQKHLRNRLAGYGSYCVDIGAIPSPGGAEEGGRLSSCRYIVIELNPFDASTDGALFKWQTRTTLRDAPSASGKVVTRVVPAESYVRQKTWWKRLLREAMIEGRWEASPATEA